MRVSHILICFFVMALFSAPVSAELIIESIATVNITDKDIISSAISPDGSTIAYISYDKSRNQTLFTINIDGSGKKQLTSDPNRKWGIEWLTDEISFISYDIDDIEKIFIVSPDGTGRRKLMNETIRQGREPIARDRFWGGASWNEEKKLILFTSLGNKGDEKIFQVSADGAGKKQLIDDDSRQWNPQWSPDGNSFVYVSQDNKNLDQLYIANADGTGKTQITDDGFKKFELNWGKDGILFVSTETQIASSEKIYIINPDGTGKRRLTDDSFNQENPRWSRDGYTIIYEDIDIKGFEIIKVLKIQKPEITPTVSPVIPTITGTIPIATTPVIEKTPQESPNGDMFSMALIIGLIVIVMLVILGISNFMSKKK